VTELPEPETVAVSPSALPQVPAPLVRGLLAFEALVLAEYWLAPLFFGLTNYAGLWSTIGVVLFATFAGTLVVGVVLPLRAHLGTVLVGRRGRLLFHGIWLGAFVAALFVTYTIQVGGASQSGSGVVLGSTTIYTPFGAWPTLTVDFPTHRLFATLNVEIVTVLGLLAFLGVSAVRLGTARAARRCEVQPAERTWLRRAASVALWSPLGLVTGCAACAPVYLAAIGLVLPAVAAGGLSSVPLVPWIGFAGFLYLASLGLAIILITHATRSEETVDLAPQEVPLVE
jgi:hypothetical protein